jgi:hypothetical protein
MAFDGIVVLAGSHLHDGATGMTLKRNNQVWCGMFPSYGTIPGYVDPSGVSHILEISECDKLAKTSLHDQWSIMTNYDFNQHQPVMDNNGSYAPVMGITIMYAVNHSANGPPCWP